MRLKLNYRATAAEQMSKGPLRKRSTCALEAPPTRNSLSRLYVGQITSCSPSHATAPDDQDICVQYGLLGHIYCLWETSINPGDWSRCRQRAARLPDQPRRNNDLLEGLACERNWFRMNSGFTLLPGT